MSDLVRDTRCERARAWAALAPDRELSQLERRLLAAHLAHCASCAAFADQVDLVAGQLRLLPLEQVPPAACPVVRRRRRLAPAQRVAGKVAAVAAATAVGVAVYSLDTWPVGDVDPGPAPAPIIVDATSGADVAEEIAIMRKARRAALLGVVATPRRAGERPGVQPV